ncbi:MAG TPA: SdrD B-like domain-containing protein [Gemmataceae bacterium]|nr:SdrD B-like domain-containing protein [Gemmataceae bacterium]
MSGTHWDEVFARAKALVGGGPAPARKPQPLHARPGLEAMEDRLVPAALDLTTAGAAGAFNGALFQQANPQPAGNGVVHAFLRIQSHGDTVEQGYNTDARAVQFDQKKDLTFTRSLLASDVPQVNVGGVAYSEFMLNINQNQSSPLLSLDELRLYVGNAPNLANYDPTAHTLGGQSAVYDMGAGNSVLLNSALAPGTGKGDMYLLVPSQLLQSAGNPYVYLYSKLGATAGAGANGGFEQWSTTAVAGSSLSGFVYTDTNGTGALAANDVPEANVIVTISGTTLGGQSVFVQTTTDAAGFYAFDGLVAGNYTLSEAPPAGFANDGVFVGSQNSGTTGAAAIFNIALQANTNGINNDFLNTIAGS